MPVALISKGKKNRSVQSFNDYVIHDICIADIVAVSLTGLNDSSMFVSKAASGFLCNWLHFSGDLHQPSADGISTSNATLETGVSNVFHHFKSLFESSSVEHGASSVFAIADELMQVSHEAAVSFIVATKLLKLSDIAVMKGDRKVCLALVGFLRRLVRVGRLDDLPMHGTNPTCVV